MKLSSLAPLLAIALGSPVFAQTTLTVPGAFPTIQSAIVAAAAGDTVLVAPGTYTESVNFLGKAITVRSSGGPLVTTIAAAAPGSVVSFSTGEGPASRLEGFRITGGTTTGVSCFATAPTIVDCTITGNSSTSSGGGFTWSAIGPTAPAVGATLVNCRIVGNTSGTFLMTIFGGGGISVDASLFGSPPVPPVITFTGCTIAGNTATAVAAAGGGFFRACQPVLERCVVRQNTGMLVRGLYFYDASATVRDCVVSDHGGTSGAVSFSGFTPPRTLLVSGSTIAGNAGAAVSASGAGSTVTLVNSVLWGNGSGFSPGATTATATDCDVQGGTGAPWFGAGCIDASPLFADAAAGDYHLLAGSPCKDAGDNAAPGLASTDFEGDPRIADGTVDMGADEFHPHLYVTGAAAPGATVSVNVVGPAGATVLLGVAAATVSPPIPTPFGTLFLDPSSLFVVPLGAIPATGRLATPATIPASALPPLAVPAQALVGTTLTNLFVLEVP